MPTQRRRRNPFAGILSGGGRMRFLERYVIGQYRRGRALDEILSDPYVRNRSTPEERAQLFDRPRVVEAIGEETIASMRDRLAEAALRGR